MSDTFKEIFLTFFPTFIGFLILGYSLRTIKRLFGEDIDVFDFENIADWINDKFDRLKTKKKQEEKDIWTLEDGQYK